MKRFYRINQYIQTEKVRVVDEKGKQLGVIPTQEALFQARQKGLDLVEVAPNAKPPVCKLIDFKKFKYQESKKLRAGKKGVKKQGLKEVRFTPFIASKDFEVRVNRAKKFLKEGYKVRLTVRFVGRQITRKQFGFELLKKGVEQLKGMSKVETEPKFQGRLLMTILRPIQQQSEENEKKNSS